MYLLNLSENGEKYLAAKSWKKPRTTPFPFWVSEFYLYAFHTDVSALVNLNNTALVDYLPIFQYFQKQN